MFHPDRQFRRMGGELIIVISNYYIRETMVRLQKTGIDLQSVYFSNELLIEPVAIDYIQEKADELSQVYDLLADYESRMIYKTLIECRVTRNIDLLGRTCRDSQYFEPDIVRFGEHEIFVDAGAFDGDTIDHFLKLVKGKYRYIYAFEPDKKNYENLKAGHRHENIYLYNMGLYSEEQEVSFLSGKGGSSQVYPDGEDVVKVCGFDRLDVPDRKVSFVKMDIEGSELNALRGMAETISRYRPALAICIYHKFEDLWEIPLFIHQLVPQYQLYIRNYTTYLDEIVLYAVAPDAEYTAKGETE